MVKSALMFAFVAAFCLCSYPGMAQDMGSVDDYEIPAELKNCKWERRDDYSKPNNIRDFTVEFRASSEIECKEECGKRVICGDAVYKNVTRECRLIPRRAFHTGYNFGQEMYTTWKKSCPIEDILNRTDDQDQMVMCPMRELPDDVRLSPKYAYKAASWITVKEDAAWWCQRDPLCQGIYRNASFNDIHVFLYKAEVGGTPTEYDTLSNLFIKDCNPNDPMADDLFFTAYNQKVVNGTAFDHKRTLNFRECFSWCESQGEDCYAAAAEEDSFRRGRRSCYLYRRENMHGMLPFRKMFDNSKVWVRGACWGRK